MLPPGLGFNAVSNRALQASKNANLPRSYWDWGNYLELFSSGFFPYTPASNLIYGLDVALDLLLSEGLEKVFAREPFELHHLGSTLLNKVRLHSHLQQI